MKRLTLQTLDEFPEQTIDFGGIQTLNVGEVGIERIETLNELVNHDVLDLVVPASLLVLRLETPAATAECHEGDATICCLVPSVEQLLGSLFPLEPVLI